ncbi:immunity protein YezG family protein [Acidisphaera sp. S103]|uniref:immunity protein YezG family protein n=1 Tax=Acidisphaera sp. S103 TaxID=1747223 RepID=UPI00131E76DD|nr:immunity protein YezG family protein [Acidisphaera sp. S103]
MNLQALELQKSLARAVSDAMQESWERIVVNYEMLTTDEGREVDYCAFYISAAGGDFQETSLRTLPDAVDDLFIQLNDLMAKTENERWGTCDLVIDRSGQYKFNFDYAAPRRVNGIFDEQSQGRFDRYLETYKTDRGRT